MPSGEVRVLFFFSSFFLCRGAGLTAIILLHTQVTLQGSQGEREVLAEMTPQELGVGSVSVSQGALVTNYHKCAGLKKQDIYSLIVLEARGQS